MHMVHVLLLVGEMPFLVPLPSRWSRLLLQPRSPLCLAFCVLTVLSPLEQWWKNALFVAAQNMLQMLQGQLSAEAMQGSELSEP